jgi:hypothetical protein
MDVVASCVLGSLYLMFFSFEIPCWFYFGFPVLSMSGVLVKERKSEKGEGRLDDNSRCV